MTESAEASPVAHASTLPGLSATRDAAFQECFAATYGALAGYCASMTGSRDLGHELAQEAFTRLFSRWVGVREPRAYVYYVATNLVRETWRRRRYEVEALRLAHARPAEATEGPNSDLRDLVERLPDHLREVVLLHYFADLPVADIARLVKRPLGTVKRRLHDARALLHDSLGGPDE